MMPNGAEIASGVYGAWRMLRFDPRGMAFFDGTVEGFWKSFYAAVLVAPGYAIVVALHLSADPPATGFLHLLSIEVLAYVVGWLAFPLAAFHLCEWIGKTAGYVVYIVAFNWSKVIQLCLYLPATLINEAGLLPTGLEPLLDLLVALVIIAYQWFVTKVALGMSGFGSAGFIMLDFAIGLLIISVTDGMIR